MDPAILLTSIFALLIGLAVTFFGERIFKISLASTGFAVGAALFGGIALTLLDNVIIALIVGGIGGVITSFMVQSAYRTGLFIIGFAMAAIITIYIALAMDAVTVDIQNLESINPDELSSMLPLIIAGFSMSLISGSLVVMFDTPILRVVTAIFGAIVFAISGFVLTTGMETLPQSAASLVSVQLFVWGAGWIPLAIAGIVFQFFGVTWLFKLLQIDQASRQEQKRRQAYHQQKQKVQPSPQQGGYTPNQYTSQQTGYPSNPQASQQGGYTPNQHSQQGGYAPNQYPTQQEGYPPNQQPPQQGGYTQNQQPPQQGGYPPSQRPPQKRKYPPNEQPPRRKP